MNRIVVVLGMHRGGTSAITRALKLLGVELGDHLLPAAADNQKGFWEDRDLHDLNVEVLRRLNYDWHSIHPINPLEFTRNDLTSLRLRAVELVRNKIEGTSLFGIKDPRIARLLPFWKSVFEELGAVILFVIALRHPRSVACSLRMRDGFEEEKSHYLWLGHVVPAILGSEGRPRVVVSYDRLMDQPETQLGRIAKALNLPVDAREGAVNEFIQEFLEERLRHTRFKFDDLLLDPAVPNEVIEAYTLLDKLARDELAIDLPEVRECFNRWAQRLNELSPAFRYMTRRDEQIAQLAQAVADRERQIDALNRGLEERNGQIAALRQTVAKADRFAQEAAQLFAEREKLTARVSELEEAVRNQPEILAEIETSLSWKLIKKFRRIKERLLPTQTKRRSIYDQIVFWIKGYGSNVVTSFDKGAGQSTVFGVRALKQCFHQLGALITRHNAQKLANHVRVFGLSYSWKKLKKKVVSTMAYGPVKIIPILPGVKAADEGKIELVARLPSIRSYRVMFLVGCLEFESKRYRVFNVIEALSLAKIEADYCFDIDIPSKLNHILSYDVLVLFRAAWSENIATLIGKARAINLPIIYDTDDYVFDPDVLDHVDGIRGWNANAVKEYEVGVSGYKRTLEHCDYFTGPTNFLTEKAAAMGKKSYLIPNTLNSRQLQISQRVFERKLSEGPRSSVLIGYFSGTSTHQKDFGMAYPALVRILSEFKHVSLQITGVLDLSEFPDLEMFGQRILRIPFVHWERLPHQMAEVDINIIPLEVANPFCDAKSELKYFEAGILRIPSVASATQTYRDVIRHGHNALLASNSEEWYEGLKSLVLDEHLRKSLGDVAYADAQATYSTAQLGSVLKNTYENIIQDSRKANGFDDQAISIVFVVPSPQEGSGGHKDIFLLANELQVLGNQVVLFFTPGDGFDSVDRLRKFIATEFCDPKFQIVIGSNIFSCDALIATHYTTAELVRKRAGNSARQFYFVQDYEPYFSPMGEEFINAERTYKFGFLNVTLGAWLSEVLRKKYKIGAKSIPFWIEKKIYFPRNSLRKPKIAFLARPEMPRRCFNLGLQTLKIFHERNPQIEIVLFGSANIQNYYIPFRHIDVGVLSKPSLADLYSEISLGMAFSTTNPSFVAYEMMACGCPVIDVQLEADYDYLKYGSRDNAFLVEPEAEDIANVLEEVLRNDARRKQVAENGLKFVESFPDISTVGRQFDMILKKAVAESNIAVTLMSEVKTAERFAASNVEASHCPSCGNLQNIRGQQRLEFFDKIKRYVFQCDRCGFIFLVPKLSEADVPSLEHEFEYSELLKPQTNVDTFQGFAQLIEGFKPAKGSCLEIGCCDGLLLKALQTRGWQVFGIERSKEAVQSASKLGVKVVQGKLEEIDLPLWSFDAIILWHVLEHINRPLDFLLKIKDIVKRDGVLVLQVPDFNKSDKYRTTNRIKDLLCAGHSNYFTVESLSKLAMRAGWKLHYSDVDSDLCITAVLKLMP